MSCKNLFAACLFLLAGSQASAATSIATLPSTAVALTASLATLTAPQSDLAMQAPGGRAFNFATTVVRPEVGMTGVRGRSPDDAHLMLFVANGRILSGDIHTSDGARYQLVRNGLRDWWVSDSDIPNQLSLEQAFSGGLMPDTVSLPGARAKAASLAATAAPGTDGKYVVDLLMLYTPLFETRYGGRQGAREEAQRLVFIANGYFENSGVGVRYRALAIEKYTRTQENASGKRNLAVLGRDPAVKAYRDQIGADLVTFLRTIDGFADVSIASYFNDFDKSDPPANVDSDRDAFTVVTSGPNAAGQRVGDFVFAHELGHNLGGGHNYKAYPVDGVYYKPYAHGYDCGQFQPGHRYVSVMSYGNLGSGSFGAGPVRVGGVASATASVFETRGDFFSSPYVTRDGMRCGNDVAGAPESELANNVRVINGVAPYVAGYRTAKVAPLFAE